MDGAPDSVQASSNFAALARLALDSERVVSIVLRLTFPSSSLYCLNSSLLAFTLLS